MAEEGRPCIECNVPGYFPTVKQLTPRMPESCTARACYRAAKLTAKASLCWLWCGGASLLTFIILLLLIPVAAVLFPFLFIYAIGILLMILVQSICECICGTNTPDACKPKKAENTQEEKEEEGGYVLRCCGNCTASGQLVYVLIFIASIPTAIVLMLVALSYLLMAGAMWCCGKKGVKLVTLQSPVDLPEVPVYSQMIDYNYI